METPPIHPAEIVRHTLFVRLVHWLIAFGFILALPTGLSLYWASILRWLQPYFGGEQGTVAIHFVDGLALSAFAVPLHLVRRKRRRWTATGSDFIRPLR